MRNLFQRSDGHNMPDDLWNNRLSSHASVMTAERVMIMGHPVSLYCACFANFFIIGDYVNVVMHVVMHSAFLHMH